MPRQTDSVAHTIRFPVEIYQFARVKAAEEHRTFNGMIVHLVAEGIKARYVIEEEQSEIENTENG